MKKLIEVVKNLRNMCKADNNDLKLVILTVIILFIDLMVLIALYYLCIRLCNYVDIRYIFAEDNLIIAMRLFVLLSFGMLISISYFATSDILSLLGERYDKFID